MTPLEERNLVWNLVELIITKHGLKIESEFLDPNNDKPLEFGNFVSGHPMCFEHEYEQTIIEISKKLPSKYEITSAIVFSTGDGHIGVSKITP